MYVFFVLLTKIRYAVVADSTYKRVLVIGGGIKEACGHVTDLVADRWHVESGVE
jgi:hypothetical protein